MSRLELSSVRLRILCVPHDTDRWGKPSRLPDPSRFFIRGCPPRPSHLFYTHKATSRSIEKWNVVERGGNGYRSVALGAIERHYELDSGLR